MVTEGVQFGLGVEVFGLHYDFFLWFEVFRMCALQNLLDKAP